MLHCLSEDEAAGRTHPNLVPVYAVVEIERKTSIRLKSHLQISMLCDGTLDYYLRLKRQHGFNFRRAEIVIILRQILEGLHYMHSKGFVHGNLNPNKGKLKRLESPSW